MTMSKSICPEFHPFSRKQLEALTWWCNGSSNENKDAVICDGAVRSGKTLSMSISFISWAFYRFSGENFAVCGKTIASLRRNVITPLIPIIESLGFEVKLKLSRNIMEVSRDGKTNLFYIFGGRDESSASLIQGMTLAGVLLDEVALMPRSFVEQALARCSVNGSKFWFNCNPEHPHHWFYEEWIKKAKQKNALYLHFTMQDNPSLTPEIISRYRSMYSGAFYERFVEGKWVAAEGLVYPSFSNANCALPPVQPDKFYVSCDYGTANPCSMGLWGRADGKWYRLREYYHDSRVLKVQKTDEEYYEELENLISGKTVSAVIVDPSALSFIECIKRHGHLKVIPAKNEVINGIRRVSDALRENKIIICPGCEDIIREFSLYRWDERAGKDTPKKEHDHAMDDMRYFVSTVLGEKEMGFFSIAIKR
jgi:PBSX family phage terminase large subunit